MKEALTKLGRAKTGKILWTMVQYGTTRSQRAFFAEGATRVWHIWHGTMSRLAHDYNMTVVAGSALIPQSRWMYDTNSYMPRSAKIYNLSFTVAPNGHVVSHTRKVNLVPTQEDTLGLSPGSLAEASETTVLPGTTIPMATAICYDAFIQPHTSHEPRFKNVLAALDQKGARLVAQPSANPWRWDEVWPFDPPDHATRPRHQQWQEEGAEAVLKTCQSVEVLINPQLLLEFLDIHFDGQSRILARQGQSVHTLVEAAQYRGPAAEAVLKSQWDFDNANVSVESKTEKVTRFRRLGRVHDQ